jgi:hypothetical protein
MKKTLISLLVLLFLAVSSVSCLAGQLLPYPKFKATDSSGVPYSGGKLYTYAAGTSTAKAAYTDVNLSTPAANPIVLDSSGEAAVYLKGKYKLILKTSADVTVWTLDNVQGMGDWEEGKYYADASETDQGATGTGNSIAAHLATIGSENAIIKLANTSGSATTSYTVSTAITIPANVTLEIEPGALIVEGTGSPTVTINGGFKPSNIAGQIFSGWEAGDITLANIGMVYAEWWYSGSGSYHTAFNCALASGTYPYLKLLAKTYSLTDEVSATKDSTTVDGSGPEATIIKFAPTGSGLTAFKIGKADDSIIYYPMVKNFTVDSDDTSYTKTAIEVTNARGFTLDHVSVTGFTDSTYASIGLKFYGRDQTIIKRPTISADLPVSVKANPGISSGVAGIEYAHFQDVYFGSLDSATGTVFKVDDNVSFTGVIFDGYNIFFGGKNGFVAENLEIGTGAVGHYLSFNNIQWDQPAAASGWFFKIACNGAAGAYLNISFQNCGIYTGSVTGYNGWSITDFAQNVTRFDNCVYPADGTGTAFGGTFTPGSAGNYPSGGTALSGGVAATLTAVDISALVPKDAKYVWGYATLSGAATAAISPKSDSGGQIAIISSAALTVPFWIPIIELQKIYYSISAGNLTIVISGYGT